MKFMNYAAALLATTSLAACGTSETDQTTAPIAETETVETQAVETETTEAVTNISYKCEDGSVVEASYPTTETATVLIDGKTVEMTSAVSASGARYTGGGWEWWTKGSTEGMLAPLAEGEETASAKGINCNAA